MAINITAAFQVTDESQVAEPRRAVQWLAEQLGFGEERAGRAALVVSELATNLVKHARSGEILLRPLASDTRERDGIEIVAVDKGPGLNDKAASRHDGFSTAGTLGHGLGAAERQADAFDIYSHASGTVVVASVERQQPRAGFRPGGRYDIGAVQVSKTGEDVCGDAWDVRTRDERLTILVADGLGHGLLAHEAANRAVSVFADAHEHAPERVIEDIHAALRGTRGAAVAMLAVDLERGTARYAGLGNIGATLVLDSGGRSCFVSHNGTAGHTAARIQEFMHPIPARSIIVLATDGLSTQWTLDAYPGLWRHSATSIAAILYRDFSRRRDDVTVVVAKERLPIAEKL